MPGLGQVDYSLVRPLTTGAERMQQMESLGTMREQRAGLQQNRAFAAEKQQMGRAEYERDLNQVRQIRQAVTDNTLEDGNLNEDGFVKSLYGIDPKFAIEAQTAFAGKRGNGTTAMRLTEIDKEIAGMDDGEQKEWMRQNRYILATSPSSAYPYSPTGIKGAGEKKKSTVVGGVEGEIETLDDKQKIEGLIARKKAYEAAIGKIQGELELSGATTGAEVNKILATGAAETEVGINKKKKESDDAVAQKAPERQMVSDLVDEITNDPAKATGFTYKRLLQAIPGTPDYTFAQKVQNLINKLSLEARGQMKGQGQISDFEGKMLAKSVSILSASLRPDDFDRELQNIKDVLGGKYRNVIVPSTEESKSPGRDYGAEYGF